MRYYGSIFVCALLPWRGIGKPSVCHCHQFHQHNQSTSKPPSHPVSGERGITHVHHAPTRMAPEGAEDGRGGLGCEYLPVGRLLVTVLGYSRFQARWWFPSLGGKLGHSSGCSLWVQPTSRPYGGNLGAASGWAVGGYRRDRQRLMSSVVQLGATSSNTGQSPGVAAAGLPGS